MDELRKIVIQDAAAMLIAYPDRANHGLFQLPVFHSQAFRDFMNGMNRHLEDSKAPYDASLKEVLPGVHERFDGLRSDFSLMRHENKEQFESIPRNIGQILRRLIRETVGALNHAVNQDDLTSLSLTSRTSTSPSEGAPEEPPW